MNNNGIAAADIEITVRGHLPGAADYVRRRLHEALTHAPAPVLAAKVTLTRHEDPAASDRISVSANIDLNGRMIHVGIDTRTVAEAADDLHDTVRRTVRRAFRYRSARRVRPGHQAVPVRDREVVEHRSISLAVIPATAAAEELDALDEAFHLFRDADTGQDCVVYRTGTGNRLARLHAVPGQVSDPAVDAHDAPRLSLAEAQERLEIEEIPFLFFADSETERGAVLYRRHDGQFGLLATAVG
ncbi:hypothetical protein HFP15_02755 [Amycolatopsis sp. K13G38]|uniref:Sigma 54 modulation/S30EA ribosomal protein C-terminal domain-containing protein n=1 Tax=Amycolatopsis acididurans TaxID=2724524 RepID=A0ABX1IWD3_9PSEU|nr:sigma 54 modulation/S30EA ribosomal C-terminal domain-containing protein [Amycolatopsis acididurans]NKQ51797.1 hypothetical protein [Amycolatopsis acididurans]